MEAVDRYGKGYVETNEVVHNGSSSLSMTGNILNVVQRKQTDNTISSASTLSSRTTLSKKSSGTKLEQVTIKCTGISVLHTHSSDLTSI